MRCKKHLVLIAGGLLLATSTSFAGPAEGPRITHFGIASPSEFPVAPEPVRQDGRLVYPWPQGNAFSLVIEGTSGPDFRPVGISTFDYDPDDPSVLPDLQILVGSDLGNGHPAVCETGDVDVGIPAVPSLEFAETAVVAGAINDLGCRFDDGEGRPAGRTQSSDACTRSVVTEEPTFVAAGSTIQFCAFIARSFGFPDGDTIVAARVRDTIGRLSAPEEIVIRVTGFNPTPTETRPTATPTPIPSATATETPTPPSQCPGDCNQDSDTIVSELLAGIDVALGVLAVDECENIDGNGDGTAGIDELTAAVRALLRGC